MAVTKKDPYYNYWTDPALQCTVCFGKKEWHYSKDRLLKKDHKFKPGKKERGLMHKARGYKRSDNSFCLDDNEWDPNQRPIAIVASKALELYVNCPGCLVRIKLYGEKGEKRKKRTGLSLKAGRRFVKHGARGSRRSSSGQEGKKQRTRRVRDLRLRRRRSR